MSSTDPSPQRNTDSLAVASVSSGAEVEQLREELRVLTVENHRLRASAAAAMAREERAEERVAVLEKQLLFLRRRSLHWYLSLPARLFGRGG
jgi:hypothetical protein